MNDFGSPAISKTVFAASLWILMNCRQRNCNSHLFPREHVLCSGCFFGGVLTVSVNVQYFLAPDSEWFIYFILYMYTDLLWETLDVLFVWQEFSLIIKYLPILLSNLSDTSFVQKKWRFFSSLQQIKAVIFTLFLHRGSLFSASFGPFLYQKLLKFWKWNSADPAAL